MPVPESHHPHDECVRRTSKVHSVLCKETMIQRCSYLAKYAKVQSGQQETVTNMLDNIPQFCVKKLREKERWEKFLQSYKEKAYIQSDLYISMTPRKG